MLAKLTVRNQLTIPKEIARQFPEVTYFDVTTDGGKVILTPLKTSRADEVRERLAEYGISASDIDDAVDWARSGVDQ
ncbi:MAG: AbrB/MazE/SpoVT family DNA-binding domain-containing protein [Spirochaeta sp.]|jgi:bifunctional DNA-binding transcriptional regulator/antitoxin component of YhaV-PrlF toxin-antitoxin module|nr:AbrB/MazE/SpoVT family DNA-binding domain-containing protein [Spirochaeta sp.]